ncbi:MAG: hypothetical protein ACJAZN_004111 [Planctomycetota bacterium]|jgi:hypothetical protein
MGSSVWEASVAFPSAQMLTSPSFPAVAPFDDGYIALSGPAPRHVAAAHGVFLRALGDEDSAGRFSRLAPENSRVPPHAATRVAYLSSMTTSTHPHFDDQGALQWYTSMAEAKAAAAAENKMIFIEFGREM